jgi:transposase
VIAGRKKHYLSTWYWHLKQHTDAKRAIVALARKLLVIIYTMLKSNQLFDEQKFLVRKEVTEQKRVSRMMIELSRLGYVISAPA